MDYDLKKRKKERNDYFSIREIFIINIQTVAFFFFSIVRKKQRQEKKRNWSISDEDTSKFFLRPTWPTVFSTLTPSSCAEATVNTPIPCFPTGCLTCELCSPHQAERCRPLISSSFEVSRLRFSTALLWRPTSLNVTTRTDVATTHHKRGAIPPITEL